MSTSASVLSPPAMSVTRSRIILYIQPLRLASYAVLSVPRSRGTPGSVASPVQPWFYTWPCVCSSEIGMEESQKTSSVACSQNVSNVSWDAYPGMTKVDVAFSDSTSTGFLSSPSNTTSDLETVSAVDFDSDIDVGALPHSPKCSSTLPLSQPSDCKPEPHSKHIKARTQACCSVLQSTDRGHPFAGSPV